MQVELTIQTDGLSRDELRALLQTMSTAWRQAVPGKIWRVGLQTSPQITMEETLDLLGGIFPPLPEAHVLDQENVGMVVELGPREMRFAGQRIATVDNMVVTVAEATEEELEALRNAPVVSLVRPGVV